MWEDLLWFNINQLILSIVTVSCITGDRIIIYAALNAEVLETLKQYPERKAERLFTQIGRNQTVETTKEITPYFSLALTPRSVPKMDV